VSLHPKNLWDRKAYANAKHGNDPPVMRKVAHIVLATCKPRDELDQCAKSTAFFYRFADAFDKELLALTHDDHSDDRQCERQKPYD
jgi:hypothetical protein